KLAGGNSSDGVRGPGTDQIQAELRSVGAVQAGELNLQENLRTSGRNIDIEEVDDFTAGAGNRRRTFCAGQIFGVAGQKDDIVVDGGVYVLPRQLVLELSFDGVEFCVDVRRIRADHEIEKELVSPLLPDNEAGLSRRLTVEKHLSRTNRPGLGDVPESHR